MEIFYLLYNLLKLQQNKGVTFLFYYFVEITIKLKVVL